MVRVHILAGITALLLAGCTVAAPVTPTPTAPAIAASTALPTATPPAAPTPTIVPPPMCQYQWQVLVPPGTVTCPAQTVRESFASWQAFEGGYMLWIEGEDSITILTSDPHQTARADDRYTADMPRTDPNITPPEGLQQPELGFGLVWREEPGIRDSLGWALSGEIRFDIVVQCDDLPTATCYYAVPGGTLAVPPDGAWTFDAR